MKNNSKRKNLTIALPFLLMQIVWGSYFIITKNFQQEVNLYFLHTARFLLLALLLLPFALKNIGNGPLIKASLLTGLFLGLGNFALNIGLDELSAVNAAFLYSLSAVFVPLFEFAIYGKKINTLRVVSIILAFTGIWILSGGISDFSFGDLVLVLAGVFSAFQIISGDNYLKKGTPLLAFLFWQMLIAGILGFFLTLFFGNFALPELNTENISIFLYLTLVSMGFGMYLLNWTQERINPVVVSIIALLQSVFGALIAWTLGHEEFMLVQLIGGSVLLLATFLSVISDKDSDLKSLD
jgi:drug/metabolite transporter (DMT)-like permease